MGYRLAENERIAAAQMLGARMARDDGQDATDGAQDAVVALLEAIRENCPGITAGRIKARLLAGREGDDRKPSHHRPLLSRSYRECLEPLPEWAQ